MEMFDLYDDNRIPLNRTIERGEKCPPNTNRMTIHICIFNSKNEMLIQRRILNKKNWGGLWDFSVGGCVQAGETTKQAATRELREELGLHHDFTQDRQYLTIYFQTGFDDYFFLEKDIDLKDVSLQAEEVMDCKWASLDEILELYDSHHFVPYIRSFIISLFDLRTQHGTILD